MALTITEKWIRERVHLDPENLDDVRSLALPGTYHEKVTHLGSSLQSFCRLKQLDLSRNALQSVDGLQHLTMLEKLNIYYNNISTLKDLYQLRHNASLQEVDLRLNPVTKNEPDYRLFMVHMLPNLRKLDDRSVRESERKAALMHFNSDQATELTEHLPVKRQPETDRVVNPRAEMVANIPRKTTVLDDDDCDVLDLIARSGGELGRPRDITGSKVRASQAATHSDAERLNRESADPRPSGGEDPPSTKYPPSPSLTRGPALVPAPAPTAAQIDGPRRPNAWDEDEATIRNRNLEERMLGLEVAGGAAVADNKAFSFTLYSPKPNPDSKDNIPPILVNPDTPNSLKQTLRLPTPNAIPDIRMTPVINLCHNISALKNTVAQSYLDDRCASELRLKSGRIEPKSGSQNHSPEKLISSSSSAEAKVRDSFKRDISPDIGAKFLSPPQNAAVSTPDDVETLTKFTSSKDRGYQNPKLNGNVSNERAPNRLFDISNDASAANRVSHMWEYGMPLVTSPPKMPTNKTPNVSEKKVDRGLFSSPSKDEKFQLHSASPLNTRPNITEADKDFSHGISKTLSDSTPSRANAKSVSFLISPAANESHDLSDFAKPQAPFSVPKSAFKQSQVLNSNNHQPKHWCAVILNSPSDEPKGSLTHPVGSHPQAKDRVRVQFNGSENGQDSNRGSSASKYVEESQAYTAYTSRGHFTPHPDANHNDQPMEQEARTGRRDQVNTHPLEGSPDTQPVPAEDCRVDLNLFLDNFLSLVDRYWNGTKSLHRHGKFQSQAHTLLSTLMNRITANVPRPRPEIPTESSAETSKLRQALRASQDQVANLKDELDTALANKRNLQANLEAMPCETPSGDRSADRSGDSSQQADRSVRSGVLEREIEKLQVEKESLKLHVKHFNQLQELATMLQESHKSLVTTNDHLLQELDETKQRHLEEVKQLHWSYGELKRTVELAPNAPRTGRHAEQGYAAN